MQMMLIRNLAVPFLRQHGKVLERSCIIQGVALWMYQGFWNQDFHRALLLGCISYWIVVLLIMTRRDNCPTKFDLAMMKWGSIPMMMAATAVLGRVSMM
jgi:hypothetical protein